MHRYASRAGALALVASSLAPLAAAGEVCYSVTIPPRALPWTDTVTLPRFDPTLGPPLSARVEVRGVVQGSVWLEHQGASPSQVTASLAADVVLERLDGTDWLPSAPTRTFLHDFTAFDGLLDYAGTSGASHLAQGADDPAEATGTPLDPDFTDLFGVHAAPPPITLGIHAVDTSTASGSSQLAEQHRKTAGVTVTVCYRYGQDCNQNGVPDDLDIQDGTSADADGNGVPDECQPGTSAYCLGIGSAQGGVDCPCGNVVPAGTISGCDHGRGGGASLTASGFPSVGNDTLVLFADGVPATSVGYFFVGTSRPDAGTSAPVFGNGVRCVEGTVTLIRKVPIGMGGDVLPDAGMPPISQLLGASPGTTQYFQYWYRNRRGPCRTHTNTTNGLRVVWGP